MLCLQRRRLTLFSPGDAGQRADTSYLDPIKVEDAPAEAIRLAAAELALRVSEERRRREVGLGNCPDLKYERMTGKIGDLLTQTIFLCAPTCLCGPCLPSVYMSEPYVHWKTWKPTSFGRFQRKLQCSLPPDVLCRSQGFCGKAHKHRGLGLSGLQVRFVDDSHHQREPARQALLSRARTEHGHPRRRLGGSLPVGTTKGNGSLSEASV